MEGIHITLKAHTLTEILGFPVTNAVVTTLIVTGLLIISAFLVQRGLKLIPGRIQTLWETLVGELYEYVAGVLESHTLARKFFPLVATIFLFVLFGNLLNFVPGIGSIGFFGGDAEHPTFVSLLHPIATDLNVTLALAIIAVIAIEIAGIITLGALKYGGKFVNFKSPLGFFIGLIDLVSELARFVSFSFRLFGNILAGEVMIAVLVAFVPIVLPVPILLFEVMVAVIQAAIFALLTLFFIKLATLEAH